MKRAGIFVAVIFSLCAGALQAGTITLPTGTQLRVVMETTINTKKNAAGDPFRARLVMPVWFEQREVVPIGTMVEGTIASLKGPGRAAGRAQMQLQPQKLVLPDGRDIVLTAAIQGLQTGDDTSLDPKEGTVKAPGKDGINKGATAGGAVLGAGVGAAIGGGTGALVGAGAVGAIAVLHQVFKRGKDADVPAGSELVLELNRPVSLSDMQEVPPAHPQAPSTAEQKDSRQEVSPTPAMQPARAADQQR